MELCRLPHLNRPGVDRLKTLASDEQVNLNCCDKYGRSPLLLLCFYNQSDSLYKYVQYLLQSKRVDVNLTSSIGWNPLPTVCNIYGGRKLLEIVKLFIRYNIDLKSTSNRTGWNVLFALILNPQLGPDPRLFEIIKVLVDAGLDVNYKDKDGTNILLALTEKHHRHPDYAKIVRFLADKGLNVNVKSVKGKPVVHMICELLARDKDLVPVIKLLIHCGVDVFARDDEGDNTYNVLKKYGFYDDSEAIRLILRQ